MAFSDLDKKTCDWMDSGVARNSQREGEGSGSDAPAAGVLGDFCNFYA